jgi:uncharacterized protein
MITIPSRDTCLDLMHQMHMPPHIQRHCRAVAQVALFLARILNGNSVRLDLSLVEAAALLHDIAKERSLVTGESHDLLGETMLIELGYPSVATIVGDHVSLTALDLDGPITESLIVNYADKRVKHDHIVTVADRFNDLMDRYARTSEFKLFMLEKLHLYLALEQKIFNHLSIGPSGKEIMSLSLEQFPQSGGEE